MSIYNISENGISQAVQESTGVKQQASVNMDRDQISEKQITPVYDEYHPEAEEPKQPIGLYRPIADEKNGFGIQFDDPDSKSTESTPAELKEEKSEKNKADADKDASHENAETCTVDTDKVDREIKHLKEKRQQLEKQLRSASDPEKIRELERKLSQVEQELQQKDNDTYRRQNADVS